MAGASPPPPPSHVAELSDECVRYVENAVGARPDYTQDTLPLVDHYLADVPEDVEPAVLGLVLAAVGAYFGEVVRRHFGNGNWSAEGEHDAWRIAIAPGPLSFNPIGVALEIVSGETAAGWGAELQVPSAHTRAVEEAIARMGEVTEAEYFTLAARFDVLEQAHAVLSARAPLH
jgi:hypothetical protein